MPYRWVDHTAEVELHIDAASDGAVFEDALRALSELVRDGRGPDRVSYDVAVSAPDRATLLAGWLDELVFRAEADGLVPDGIEQLRLGDSDLAATVTAHHGEPRHLVKGVAYDRLAFDREGDRVRAFVVLDV